VARKQSARAGLGDSSTTQHGGLIPAVSRVEGDVLSCSFFVLSSERMGRWRSGQSQQTVNLPPHGLRRFESSPAHSVFWGTDAAAGLPAEAPESAGCGREGGSNSVVESQPSKLLVAGSIPVSRSILRSRLDIARELRLASQPRSTHERVDERRMASRDRRGADLSAEAPKARRPM
jgi:hypothetical protein